MIAVPLSKTAPRQGRYAKMAVAILLYIGYSNLLVVAMNWVRKGVVVPEIGMVVGTYSFFNAIFSSFFTSGGLAESF